jgi:hypothetical protein
MDTPRRIPVTLVNIEVIPTMDTSEIAVVMGVECGPAIREECGQVDQVGCGPVVPVECGQVDQMECGPVTQAAVGFLLEALTGNHSKMKKI